MVRGLQNYNLTVIEGTTVSLQFVIEDANPPVQTHEIVWLFGNDVRLNLFPNGTVFQGTRLTFSEDYLSVVLANITYNISGRITLQARNAAGQSQDHVNIIVHGKKFLHYISKKHKNSINFFIHTLVSVVTHTPS